MPTPTPMPVSHSLPCPSHLIYIDGPFLRSAIVTKSRRHISLTLSIQLALWSWIVVHPGIHLR